VLGQQVADGLLQDAAAMASDDPHGHRSLGLLTAQESISSLQCLAEAEPMQIERRLAQVRRL